MSDQDQDECKACATRRKRGLEGLCPSCANIRAKAELEKERADTWTCEPVDRSGSNAYIHLIRSKDDPDRAGAKKTEGRGWGARNDLRIKKSATLAECRLKIIALFAADPAPRTFNRICVELMDVTADVAFDGPLDHAVWKLVEEKLLEHTMTAPVLFRRRAAGADADTTPISNPAPPAPEPAPKKHKFTHLIDDTSKDFTLCGRFVDSVPCIAWTGPSVTSPAQASHRAGLGLPKKICPGCLDKRIDKQPVLAAAVRVVMALRDGKGNPILAAAATIPPAGEENALDVSMMEELPHDAPELRLCPGKSSHFFSTKTGRRVLIHSADFDRAYENAPRMNCPMHSAMGPEWTLAIVPSQHAPRDVLRVVTKAIQEQCDVNVRMRIDLREHGSRLETRSDQ